MDYKAFAVAIAVTFAAQVAAQSSEDAIKSVVADRNAKLVSVIRYGQFFHRHDHLVQPDVTELSPEEAIKSGYARCPECKPPTTTELLLSQSSKPASGLTSYYRFYLSVRGNPTGDAIPIGERASVYGDTNSGGYRARMAQNLNAVRDWNQRADSAVIRRSPAEARSLLSENAAFNAAHPEWQQNAADASHSGVTYRTQQSGLGTAK